MFECRSAQTLLVGLALDDGDRALVERAFHLAGPARAQVHLAHAFAPSAKDGADGVEAQRAALAERFAAHAEELAAAGARGLHVEPGTPHRMLLDLARRIGADLLIVGSGTVADRLIASGWANVLVVQSERPLPAGTPASQSAVSGLFLG